jgi:hypothetical protein
MTINPSVEAKTVPEFVAYLCASGGSAVASAIAPYQMSVCTKKPYHHDYLRRPRR